MKIERDIAIEGKALSSLVKEGNHPEIFKAFNSLLDEVEKLKAEVASFVNSGFITQFEVDNMRECPKVEFRGNWTSMEPPYLGYSGGFEESYYIYIKRRSAP